MTDEKGARGEMEQPGEAQMSNLAQMMASVPNLFSRDCRVRLIVKEEADA